MCMLLGNCDKFYFTYVIVHRNRVQRVSNLTEYKWIFVKGWKTEVKLFVNSRNLSLFLCQHCILSYSFANIPFEIGSMGSVFMINDDLNGKLLI